MPGETAVEKHARWIRWTHWLNVPFLALMIWSGLRIYWANPAYRPWFFPEKFFAALDLRHHLADGMAVHFTVMWLFAINGMVYVYLLLATGEWRTWRGKFGFAQRHAYIGVLGMATLMLLSGLAIYKPTSTAPLVRLFGGYEGARLVHFALTMALVGFVLVHVIQVARAGWSCLRAMLTGYERDEEAA